MTSRTRLIERDGYSSYSHFRMARGEVYLFPIYDKDGNLCQKEYKEYFIIKFVLVCSLIFLMLTYNGFVDEVVIWLSESSCCPDRTVKWNFLDRLCFGLESMVRRNELGHPCIQDVDGCVCYIS